MDYHIVYTADDGREVRGDRHINPDGSIGGIIPQGVEIPENVFIHRTAVVQPGATLEPGQQVGPYEVVQ